MSELDTANAAPPASDTERKSALVWIAAVVVLGVIALIVTGVLSFKTHKAEVAKIESAPVELPPIKLEPKKKDATKKVAKQTIEPHTPAASVPDVRQIRTTENDSFTSDFDKRVIQFERTIP